jgi:hypothetical protein
MSRSPRMEPFYRSTAGSVAVSAGPDSGSTDGGGGQPERSTRRPRTAEREEGCTPWVQPSLDQSDSSGSEIARVSTTGIGGIASGAAPHGPTRVFLPGVRRSQPSRMVIRVGEGVPRDPCTSAAVDVVVRVGVDHPARPAGAGPVILFTVLPPVGERSATLSRPLGRAPQAVVESSLVVEHNNLSGGG